MAAAKVSDSGATRKSLPGRSPVEKTPADPAEFGVPHACTDVGPWNVDCIVQTVERPA
jgi:hypothetical protein